MKSVLAILLPATVASIDHARTHGAALATVFIVLSPALEFHDMATRRGTARGERLDGTAAGDSLLGLAGKDKLFGLAGNDVLDGGSGADLLTGGRGNDVYIVDNVGDQVVARRAEGIDTVRASVSHTLAAEVENLLLFGNAGANRLTGNSAGNILSGGAGNDVLNGGGGVDLLRGGAGDDNYVVNAGAVRIQEGSGAGFDTVHSSVSYTLPLHVEQLVLLGNLFVHGGGNALANTLVGAAGINVLDGGGGNDYLDGGAGNDTLRGGAGGDTLVVDNANDSIDEAAPVTLLTFSFQNLGGTSFDNPATTLQVSAIAQVSAWATQDTASLLEAGLNGFAPEPNRGRAIAAIGFDDGDPLSTADDGNALLFSFVLAAGQSIDLSGFSFNEQASNGARGNGPSNWLMRINDEQVAAGAVSLGNPGGHQSGDWHLQSLAGLTGTVGGGGTDHVQSSVDFTLPSGVEQLTLTGSQALRGTGNEFANVIIGNDAANLLDGAAGADRVTAAAGDDVLVYDALDELLDGGTGVDTLRTAGSGITLDLRAIDDARLLHIDHIDVRGSGDNSLLLNVSDVLALGADGDILRVSGDVGDSLTSIAEGWLADGGDAQVIDGVQYQAYSAGNAHLLVALDLLTGASLS